MTQRAYGDAEADATPPRQEPDTGIGGLSNGLPQEVMDTGGNLPPEVVSRGAHLDLSACKDLPVSENASLLILSWDNPLRLFCRTVYIDTRFGNTVLVLILANCVLMFVQFAWPNCSPHPCGMDPVDTWLDLSFTIAFTAEMFIKVITLGFACHPKAYIRSAWNVLDCIIVLSSWIGGPIPLGAGSAGSVSVLRLLRVLRPLRTMSRVAGLRTLMAALFGAMPEILDNILLLGFLMLIFAILGVQLFQGALHQRCLVYPLKGEEGGEDWPQLLTGGADSAVHCGGTMSCDQRLEDLNMSLGDSFLVRCGSDTELPSQNRDGLSRDPLHFDNLGSALLLIFKVFTGDDWPEDMNELQNSIGHTVFLYYFFCIMVGGLFATNLFLAVLISAYYTNANNVNTSGPGPEDMFQVRSPTPELIIDATQRRLSKRASTLNRIDATGCPDTAAPPASTAPDEGRCAEAAEANGVNGAQEKAEVREHPPAPGAVEQTAPRGGDHADGAPSRRIVLPPLQIAGADKQPSDGVERSGKRNLPHRRPTFAAASIPPASPDHHHDHHNRSDLFDNLPQNMRPSVQHQSSNSKLPPVSAWGGGGEAKKLSVFERVRHVVGVCVMLKATQNFIMVVTVFNVLVLAADHHEIDETFNTVLDVSNLVCTIIFAVEIGVKTFGLGFRKTYMEWDSGSGWNCLDLFLVAISLPDLAQGGSSSFTAFRAFRLMKLVRRFPSVYTQLQALISSLSEGVYVSLLLLLLIFIFSILGMMFFEDKFESDLWPAREPQAEKEYDRTNFNTLWEAALTCFVIITGDAWGAIMKQGMKQTSTAYCLYFLVLFLLGNFVLVNVFVAVILDKLDQASNEADASHVVLRITGAEHGCDGIYRPDDSSMEHELLWKMDLGEDDGDIPDECRRYLYSTDGERQWVVWHSLSRDENDGYLTSDVHEGKMPNEVTLWRQNYVDKEWDDRVRVEVACEEDGPNEFDAALKSLAPEQFTPCMDSRLETLEVPRGNAGIAEAAGVRLSAALRVEHVDPLGLAATCGVTPAWILSTVSGVRCHDREQAEAVFGQECGPTVTVGFRPPVLGWFTEELRRKRDAGCCSTRALKLKGVSCLPRSLRNGLAIIVHSTAFDMFILFVIGANVVFLAVEHPGADESLKSALDVSNYVFTSIFFVEMVLKVAVLGFYDEGEAQPRLSILETTGGKESKEAPAYFSDPWNVLDCFVVVTAIAGLVPDAGDMKAFRSLRTLRLVIRSPQLRIVIEALVSTLPKMSAGLAVSGFIFFVFAILGLSLFKGKFYTCDGGEVAAYQASLGVSSPSLSRIPEKDACLQYNGTWVRSLNSADHFDNVGNSLLTLGVVAIGEGWSPIMYMGIDATGVDSVPRVNRNPHLSLFFVVFHVVGNFFCLNMVIGILIQEFTSQRRELDGTQGSFLDEKKQSYIQAEKAVLYQILFRPHPTPPKNDIFTLRTRCYKAVQHPHFDRMVTTIIIINMLVFATVHHRQSSFWDEFQKWGNWICSIFFIAEAATKIVGLGPAFYFGENWNRFDFVIVGVSVLDMFHVPGLSGISAVRVLRVGRLFRLVAKAKGLQKLFNTMFQGDNLYYFGNIGIFCIAIIFMFAVAGVNLFGTAERHEGIDHNLNFENVGFAMVTLFTTSTTEAWLNVRDGLMNYNMAAGHIYAIVWIVVGSIVLLNLFAAVVVELFDKQEAQVRCRKEIDAIEEFRSRWRECWGVNREVEEVDIQDFVDAVRDHDLTEVTPEGHVVLRRRRGLLPTRLRQLPRCTFLGAQQSQDQLGMEEDRVVNLPCNPSDIQLLVYLTALGLPLWRSSAAEGPRTVVRYKDVAYCLASRAYGLRAEDIREIQRHELSRGPKVRSDAFMASHWLAARMVQRKLGERAARKRANSDGG